MGKHIAFIVIDNFADWEHAQLSAASSTPLLYSCRLRIQKGVELPTSFSIISKYTPAMIRLISTAIGTADCVTLILE